MVELRQGLSARSELHHKRPSITKHPYIYIFSTLEVGVNFNKSASSYPGMELIRPRFEIRTEISENFLSQRGRINSLSVDHPRLLWDSSFKFGVATCDVNWLMETLKLERLILFQDSNFIGHLIFDQGWGIGALSR